MSNFLFQFMAIDFDIFASSLVFASTEAEAIVPIIGGIFTILLYLKAIISPMWIIVV